MNRQMKDEVHDDAKTQDVVTLRIRNWTEMPENCERNGKESQGQFSIVIPVFETIHKRQHSCEKKKKVLPLIFLVASSLRKIIFRVVIETMLNADHIGQGIRFFCRHLRTHQHICTAHPRVTRNTTHTHTHSFCKQKFFFPRAQGQKEGREKEEEREEREFEARYFIVYTLVYSNLHSTASTLIYSLFSKLL